MRDRRDGRPFAPGLTAGAPHRRALARLAALAVCVPLLGGWTKGSGVEIVSRYYSKHGADHAELVASVRRNGPKGGQAYGIGYIDFFPRYRTAFVAGVCRIDEAEVGLRFELEHFRRTLDRSVSPMARRSARRTARVVPVVRPSPSDAAGARQRETLRTGCIWPKSVGFRLGRCTTSAVAETLDLGPNALRQSDSMFAGNALELPRWDGVEGGPAKAAKFACRFTKAIEAHEMEHVRIARHYARRMRSELLRLKADSSCWSLSSRAEDLIRDLKKRHIESQKAFDRRVDKQIKRLL